MSEVAVLPVDTLREAEVLSFPKPLQVPNLRSPICLQFYLTNEHLQGTVMGDPVKESQLSDAIDRANAELQPERGRRILAHTLSLFGVNADVAIQERGVVVQKDHQALSL